MVYIFHVPLDDAQACALLKRAIYAIDGTVKERSDTSFVAKWRSKKYYTILPKKFDFHIENGIVTVNQGTQNMEILAPKIRTAGAGTIWDRFVEMLISQNPEVDFGLVAGDLLLSEVEIIGEATEQIYVRRVDRAPSLLGAIIGGELFGPIGAFIGGVYGGSKTTYESVTRSIDGVVVRGRYSNGLLTQRQILRTSPLYKMIVENYELLE